MGMRGSVPRSPHLLLALVVVVWAGSYAAIKQLIDDGLAAPDIALGRYLVAAPGFAIALVATRGLPGLGRRDLARLIAAGLLVVTIYHLSLNAGERLTTAGTAAVLVAAAPGIALAMEAAIRQERFPGRRAASLGGTAALLPFAAGGTVHRVSALVAGGIVLLLYLGLVATLLGYIGWTRGLRQLEASRTVAYLYGVPVVAIVIGALVLGESVTGWLGLGG